MEVLIFLQFLSLGINLWRTNILLNSLEKASFNILWKILKLSFSDNGKMDVTDTECWVAWVIDLHAELSQQPWLSFW